MNEITKIENYSKSGKKITSEVILKLTNLTFLKHKIKYVR